jgi:hypothetical protein
LLAFRPLSVRVRRMGDGLVRAPALDRGDDTADVCRVELSVASSRSSRSRSAS